MFSGIVEAVGSIHDLLVRDRSIDLIINRPAIFNDLKLGDSIAVNGVCLTITALTPATLQVTAVPETIRLTNLGLLTKNSLVNLERAITLSTRLGGHYVQGHVDGVGEIRDIQAEGDALLIKISLPSLLDKYVVRKGYITLDGMSITVIDTASDWLTVTVIPHTQQVTIVNQYRVGSKINLEVDIVGKYIEKLASIKRSKVHAAVH